MFPRRYVACVGHNLSERRAGELREENRRRDSAGWVIEKDGLVTEPQTPAALAARGALLRGFCRGREDCFRKVTFNAPMWCARGFGFVPLSDAKAAYRCAIVSCGLNWQAESYPHGLPLGSYLGNPHASIAVSCPCGAGALKTFTVRRFVQLIGRAGTGSPALAAACLPSSLIRGPCSWCRERRWSITLHVAPSPTLKLPTK